LSWLSRLDRSFQIVKRRRKLAASDVAIVSPAKSGRTWLSAMLSHVYHQRHGIPESLLIRGDNFHRLDPRVPRVFFTHDNRKDEEHRPLFGVEDFRDKKVVLLVRDPRDVAVSAHFAKPRNARRVGAEQAAAAADPRRLFDFVVSRKLPQVLAFLTRWRDQLPRLERALVVRYEDLRERPEAELARVVGFVDGRPPDADEIARAVAFASFESLRAKEASGFFASDRLRPAEPAHPGSHKVRRGQVGGHREHFTPDQLAHLDAMLAEAKLDSFGYAP
jgi:alcohol sulfotransferase